MKTIVTGCIILISNMMGTANAITQMDMEKYVVTHTKTIAKETGYVGFIFNDVTMALISDVKHDRMRIISHIAKYSNLKPDVKNILMESNFHLALDARYAVSGDILYSAYIHPLSSLTLEELKSAINQVSTLASTFGTTYSSGLLKFNDASKR